MSNKNFSRIHAHGIPSALQPNSIDTSRVTELNDPFKVIETTFVIDGREESKTGISEDIFTIPENHLIQSISIQKINATTTTDSNTEYKFNFGNHLFFNLDGGTTAYTPGKLNVVPNDMIVINGGTLTSPTPWEYTAASKTLSITLLNDNLSSGTTIKTVDKGAFKFKVVYLSL